MLKNKIYKYLSIEIFKNFITILFTFTAIAWTVRAVNFLDLMIEDGYSAIIYFKYSFLNISAIITRFVPLAFLISMIISVTRFQRQQELIILWTVGLSKLKIANIFFLISIFIALIQIILALIVNPFTLNKSRALLRESQVTQINATLRSNDFSDSFKGITFFIEKKNTSNELINVFIKDKTGTLNAMVTEFNNASNTTIIAKKGFVVNNKLILFDGIIQTLDTENKIKNIYFEKTEFSVLNLSTRTIIKPKLQETSSLSLFKCLAEKNLNKIIQNCEFKDNKKEVMETISRRAGMPLYIPLISVIVSFLLMYKKENKYNYLKKYIVFVVAFVILLFAEIFIKYTGISFFNLSLYFFTPIILFLTLYFILLKNLTTEKLT